ncbi:MAG: hypothetical protein EPN61_17545 [Burkholderiaceae bacterium]|nr:MAG: hypothetical protein EPN61_17545 [Burkholderiaceae bacterium]
MTNGTNEASVFDGQHSETGFTGRSVTSARAEMRQAGRNESALVGTSPASYGHNDMPLSREVLAQQHRDQAIAESSVWFDRSTNAPVVSANVHSDHDPSGYLAAHGFYAVNDKGEEVATTPRQARGLIGRYMDSLERGGGESISFRDEGLHPSRANVWLRSR